MMNISLKRIFSVLFFACLGLAVSAQSISSPDGNITVKFSLTGNGVPTYEISYKGKEVIKPSTLGIELNEEHSLMDQFRINKVSTSTFD